MGQGDGKKQGADRPLSAPPQIGELDSAWDADIPDPFGPLPGQSAEPELHGPPAIDEGIPDPFGPLPGAPATSPQPDQPPGGAGYPDPFGPLPSQHLGEPPLNPSEASSNPVAQASPAPATPPDDRYS